MRRALPLVTFKRTVLVVLLGLLTALSWLAWFVLQPSIVWPLVATGLFGSVLVGAFVLRRARARRSARALEQALDAQGQAQLHSAKPEKRIEIQALRKQMAEGISALKASHIGGRKRGADALYALPWYAIIGPPGVGKTTALRHSGLSFPHVDDALRGVGGTRNCDWWLSHEAILLDTAGRYATETDDQKEWLAFLDILRDHRVEKPLNGLIVAVALPDVLDASSEDIDAMGQKLRQRIDEVMTRLRMTLPVYFLVTKCDLVAGFVELFGDLRKSQRAQPWGATIPLGADKSAPGELFANEFDAMMDAVHARSLGRLNRERNRRAREHIYRFPIELASVRNGMQQLIGNVFTPNAFQMTPTFRGFYFTSGTQEGRPSSRAIARMSQAMGVVSRQPETARVESKSYFLHDVFTKVVFPDAELASRSRGEIRRQRIIRWSIAAAAIAMAGMIVGPSVHSYRNNRELIDTTQAAVQQANDIDWQGAEPISEKLAELAPSLAHLQRLDRYADDGAPYSYRFWMYTGNDLRPALVKSLTAQMERSFVPMSKQLLEQQLNSGDGSHYFAERETLKTYLMLTDATHLDVPWAASRLTLTWAQAEKPTSDISVDELRSKMESFVTRYLTLLAESEATPVAADDTLVERVRQRLMAVPVAKRYDSLFIDSVGETLYDPAAPYDPSNLQFPPLTLDRLFSDMPAALSLLRSREHQRKQRYFTVPGPYTDKGHYGVLANIAEAEKLLATDAWVVALTDDDRGTRLLDNIRALSNRYEEKYIRYWEQFFADIEIAEPATLDEAVALYNALQKEPEWPLLRLIRALEDHTQWTKGIEEVVNNDAVANLINRRANAAFTRRVGGLRANFDVRKIGNRASVVPPRFRETVKFGVMVDGATSSLHQYMEAMSTLKHRMLDELTRDPEASVNTVALDAQKARKRTEALLAASDPATKRMISHLLVAPLRIGDQSTTVR